MKQKINLTLFKNEHNMELIKWFASVGFDFNLFERHDHYEIEVEKEIEEDLDK